MRHLVVLTLALGLGVSACRQPVAKEKEASPAAAALDMQRYEVRLLGDEYALGGEHPLVTVVLFSNYACPPCRKAWQVMRNLLEDYRDDLRVVYRSVHIPGYKANDEAVDAVYAAGAQGKFWEMHWRLFDHAQDFSRPVLEAHAEALGLDLARFRNDLDQGVGTSRRLADQRAQRELGIFAGPAAFANGVLVLGYRSEDVWHLLLDQEVSRAKIDLANGVLRSELYATVQKSARKGPIELDDASRKALPADGVKADAANDEPVQAPDPSKRYRIDTTPGQSVGPADALVEVVEFTDFQCPYCKKGNDGVFSQIRQKYAKDLRWSIVHLPLPMHVGAKSAAMAASAAGRQGKFWPYHDQLFQESRPFVRDTYVAIAKELGLDLPRFESDYAGEAVQAAITSDLEKAAKLGILATPILFINGRMVEGATTLETYTQIIDEEVAAGNKLVASGTPRSEVQAKLMHDAIGPEKYPNPRAKPLIPQGSPSPE